MRSIGDFAESLIMTQTQNIQEGKELPPDLADAQARSGEPAAKDITQVDVPDDFMKQVLGEEFYPQDTPPVESMPEIVWTDSEQEEEQKPTPQTLTEETAQQLVPLLEEVRNLLKEMTTCGSIGVNMAGPQKHAPTDNIERKHGYLTSRKPKNKRDVLKQSIRNRLSRR